MTDWEDLTPDEKAHQLKERLDEFEARVDTIGACAARADKNRELINSLRRAVGQLGFVDLEMDEDAGDNVMRQVPDEIIDAVEELYPADTVTRGVKTSMVADELGMSCRGVRTRLKRLADEGKLRGLAGLRGPTYAPIDSIEV